VSTEFTPSSSIDDYRLLILGSALIVSAAVLAAAFRIASATQAARPDATRARALDLMAMFAPALSAAADDPRAILVWQPLARMARQLYPEAFALIEQAAGGPFPFSQDQLQSAHARWTADWLAWERTHDAEYKLRAATVEQEIAVAGTSALLRARLDAIESEKLNLYQRRYEEYTRVAKALQALSR
jgi:hypothetical protein